ncbi:Ribosomal protein [Trema orientale]|uniref:Ribosomal protein n=1 Tax=Trema orientale TaxID=63057 RepID=A0A2P5FXF2_TREOI|nr:Ribosomal protein [Trema orientale]
MSKLGLVRTAIRSVRTVRASGHGFHARRFSTESEPQQTQDQAVDSFLRTSAPGSVYARLHGITRNTLKTDIVNLLEGCNLGLEDVKVDYLRNYNPAAMLVHFSSTQAYEQANRTINRKGRLYKLERVGKPQWDFVAPYDGKTVLLQGVPRNAIFLDIERFLSGCEYDASSVQFFLRAGFPDKMATVRFPSQTQAMNCFITRNKGFCLNNRILVRVLQ